MTQLFDGVTTPKFEDIVGEGKTYSDNEAAAKAIFEKDRFIDQLKRELREVREDFTSLQARKEAEDRLNSLENAPQPETGRQPAEGAQPEKVNFEELVAKELDKREATRQRNDNLNTVKNKFREVFGEDYAASVKQLAEKAGVSLDFLEDAALRSPQAVFAVLGLNSPQQKKDSLFSAPPQGHSFAPRVQNEHNYAYFRNMRRTDPKKYHSIPVQQEMHRLAHEQGADFYKE